MSLSIQITALKKLISNTEWEPAHQSYPQYSQYLTPLAGKGHHHCKDKELEEGIIMHTMSCK